MQGCTHVGSPTLVFRCQTWCMTANSGIEKTYWKVPFEWTNQSSPPDRASTAEVSWNDAESDNRLFEVVSESLAVSMDPSDVAAVNAIGAEEASRELLRAVPKWGCSKSSGWWQLLIDHGEAVGFVLPVTYDDSVRDGNSLGTIFHMGVVPAYRSRGFGRLLLRKATQTLMGSAVRRIYCDTAVANAPMIHLFESEGWTRLPNREVPVPEVFVRGKT